MPRRRSKLLHLLESLESRRLLTVLTFDPVAADGAVLSTSYGDRVAAASQNGFTYGTTDGTTQNVNVSYGPVAANVHQWTTGYGDLHNVIFAGDAAAGTLDITLTADLGYSVSLTSLELAGTGNKDRTVNSITIKDGAGNTVMGDANVSAPGTGHNTLSYSNIVSRILTIHIDATNLTTNADQIGIDNIQFSQVHTTSPVGDGYGDVVLAYHDGGAGPIAGPYGGTTDSEAAAPVGLDVVLGGDTSPANYLSLPTGSSVTIGFADETIVDAPGNDFGVSELVDNGERAKVFVSSDFVNFSEIGIARGGRESGFDLASINFTQPVRAIKIEGLDTLGASPGFDLEHVRAFPASIKAETFRFPIGNGTDMPTILNAWGSGNGFLGEDYATPSGKNVFPMMFGQVTNVITGDASLGNAIIVQHSLAGGATFYSLYAHLSKILVASGQQVSTDTKIGVTGSTGDSTSPNLRLQVFSSTSALTQNLGSSFNNLMNNVFDANGIEHFKPSWFITQKVAYNIPNLTTADLDNNGVLNVGGTDSADTISIASDNSKLTVTRNGVTYAFPASITKSIVVTAKGGNDDVSIGSGVIGSYIDGGDGNDLLSGGDGKDTLTGGAGKNTLLGNGGDDRLNGSGSRDSLDGGDGNDRLYGNDGDDTLTGDAGVDRLFGGNGNDSLAGGSSNDKLYGEAGNDTLFGNNQNDSLEGGSGDDSLIGGSGNDTMLGNDGSDRFQARDGEIDTVEGDAGPDSANLDPIDIKSSIEERL